MVSSRESLVRGVVCERLRRIETRATGAVAQLTVRSVCRTDVRLWEASLSWNRTRDLLATCNLQPPSSRDPSSPNTRVTLRNWSYQ